MKGVERVLVKPGGISMASPAVGLSCAHRPTFISGDVDGSCAILVLHLGVCPGSVRSHFGSYESVEVFT